MRWSQPFASPEPRRSRQCLGDVVPALPRRDARHRTSVPQEQESRAAAGAGVGGPRRCQGKRRTFFEILRRRLRVFFTETQYAAFIDGMDGVARSSLNVINGQSRLWTGALPATFLWNSRGQLHLFRGGQSFGPGARTKAQRSPRDCAPLNTEMPARGPPRSAWFVHRTSVPETEVSAIRHAQRFGRGSVCTAASTCA